jgi:hypothetical protein
MINFSASHLATLRGQSLCDPQTPTSITLDSLTLKIASNFQKTDPNYPEALQQFTTKIRHDKAFREAGITYHYDTQKSQIYLQTTEDYFLVPIYCKIQLFYQNWKHFFVVLLGILAVGNIYIWKAWKGIRVRRRAQMCYREILEDLQGKLKIRVRDLKGRCGGVEEVWGLVDRIRRGDECVFVVEEEWDGVYEEMWTLRAGGY